MMRSGISILVIAAISALAAQKTVSITSDTVISSPMKIPVNTTLMISKGVNIYVDGYLPIIVEGLLVAQGTSDKPITITGKDRPRGSVDASSWQGLVIRGDSSDAVLKNVRIEGAYRNVIWNSRPAIDSCTFTGNNTGLFCSGGASPRISACKIFGNVYGVVAESCAPVLLDNTITGNKIGLRLQLGAKAAVGRNNISGNNEDTKDDDFLGGTKNPSAVKQLWEIMNQLY